MSGALELATWPKRWTSGVSFGQTFLLPNVVDRADSLIRSMCDGLPHWSATLHAWNFILELYIDDPDNGAVVLDAMVEHMAHHYPAAQIAHDAAVEKVRQFISGKVMQRRPGHEILSSASRVDTFGLWKGTIADILATEAAWWIRQRAPA